jgi:hypothetical protein
MAGRHDVDAARALTGQRTAPGIGLENHSVRPSSRRLPVSRRDRSSAAAPGRSSSTSVFPAEFVADCPEALVPDEFLVVSKPNRLPFSPDGRATPSTHGVPRQLARLLATAFITVRLLGVGHGRVLGLVDAVTGSMEHRLMAEPFDSLPLSLRAVVAACRASAFRIGPVDRSTLDLLTVAE